ncbi:hypothetical protein [Streptomyces prunicolor]|uniref:hypothetical protein n=1 Tax=Streptomyces prunicolor TaxID=67348 RepID=UPI001319C6FF|nr:hypothetical protein [Streptomyces prunicolor]
MRRRRNREQPHEPFTPTTSGAIAIAIQEIVTVIEILEHAHSQITELSDASNETISSASGSTLIPSLYARAGLASINGRHDIPLLASEISLLEAAVINLESYDGNETVLCAGYELLDNFTYRRRNADPLSSVHGILTFAGEAGDTASGPATPSLA